jgi:AraC family transcriptional regulator
VGLHIGFPSSPAWARHEPQLRRVIEYVYDHLDAPLDLDSLSDLACLSPHHWHRLYHAMVGETMAQTVRRLRLHRACSQLASSTMAVSRIAKQAGYADAQTFTRAFKLAHHMGPLQYRLAGEHRCFEMGRSNSLTPTQTNEAFAVTLVKLESLSAYGLEHQGAYLGVGRAFDLLWARVAAAGLARPGMRMLALFHDDPSIVPAAALRSTAVVAGCAPAAMDSNLTPISLDGGLYARLSYTGPYASMAAAYRWLFGHWIALSPYQVASGPVIEEYLNSPREAAPMDLQTFIHVPLEFQETAEQGANEESDNPL